MGGRHTPIPLQFDAHGLNITSISLSEPSLEVNLFPRRALGRCIRARASLFVAKLWRRRRSTGTDRSRGCANSEYFCDARVDPWYLIEASLKIVGFVFLHKVPKKYRPPRVFWKFSAHCKNSGYLYIDCSRNPSRQRQHTSIPVLVSDRHIRVS